MEELKGGVEFADSSKFYSVLSRIDTKTRNLLNDSVFFPRLHFLSFLLFRMTCHFLLCVCVYSCSIKRQGSNVQWKVAWVWD